MLRRFGLTDKIHTVNADNASSNRTQVEALEKMDNNFDGDNYVRCFNHTLQLCAKALIKPFNMAICGKKSAEEDEEGDVDGKDMPDLEDVQYEDDEEDTDDTDVEDGDDIDDDVNELDELDDKERDKLIVETTAVRLAVSKVSSSYCSEFWTKNIYAASTTLLCHHSFDDYRSSCLAPNLWSP